MTYAELKAKIASLRKEVLEATEVLDAIGGVPSADSNGRVALRRRISLATATARADGYRAGVEASKKFVDHALAVIPYVRATVSPGNRFPASRTNWCEVHEGRADSSVVQLDNLEREAMAIRALAPAAKTEEP